MQSDKINSLLSQIKSANINKTNNNNNTNNTNNKLTTSTFASSNAEEEVLVASPSLGEESLGQKKKDILKLPPQWRGVKLDLYCNGANKDGSEQLKLNVGVLRKEDGKQIALQASLNSSWDSGVRRGIDAQDWRESSHWIRVRQHRKELEYIYEPRASKIGLKQKSGGTEMVAFVYKDRANTWCVDIVRDANTYSFELADPLSSAQQKTNMIATVYCGQRKRKLIKPEELGI